MEYMTHNDIRETWFRFFLNKEHQIYESASLIPVNDDSLLWINAGVAPLKKYFDGREVPDCRRIVNIQKCIRTNDIENVGITKRHQTFFEMMGNFSVGDYFKKEAISYAFELLTSKEYFAIPKDLIYVTVYKDDIEAKEEWEKVGLDSSHIIPLEGNFWEIGEGPCGPDSEIFFDRGEKYDDGNAFEKFKNDLDQERFVEIWNNVFSQFNSKEGVDRKDYQELPSKNIDTGAGLERWCCIFQNVDSNFETDLFKPIIKHIEELSHYEYVGQKEFKIIADHVRAITFALADGACFENVGRGYVLRRLLRRASRMGRKLNINRDFLKDLVTIVVDNYKEIYPNLAGSENRIKKLIEAEELLFQKTLLSGEKRLEELFASDDKVISGKDAFKLYDTYGYPIELTIEAASERGFTVDRDEFNSYMNAQKELARSSRKEESSMNLQNDLLINYKKESTFVGYEKLGLETEIMDIMVNNVFVDSASEDCYIFLKENPFYAESGGQVSDSGYLKNDNCKLEVMDVIKAPNGQHLLYVKVLKGTVNKGDKILTHVSKDKRIAIMKNHSSVHLLQKSLQELLGNNVHQAGSKVDENELRFDFNYHGRLSDELIIKIEDLVNERIAAGYDTDIQYMSLEEAKKKGAMALFSDKYGDVVRVVTMGDSIELCAGTHVNNTKEIGKFAIASVENKGTDTFRVIATSDKNISSVLGKEISRQNDMMLKLLDKAKKIVTEAKKLDIDLVFDFDINEDKPSSYRDIVVNKNELENIRSSIKNLEKEFIEKRNNKAVSDLSSFMKIMENINDVNTIISITSGYDVNTLKQIISHLSNQVENSLIVLANLNEDKSVNFIAKSTSFVNAGLIVKDASVSSNGNGGGSPKFAQGGGKTTKFVSEIIKHIEKVIKEANE